MKTLFRRSLTTLMCAGTLIVGTQSWAADAKQKTTVNTEITANSKVQKKCPTPCNMKNDEKTQQNHSQHGKMTDMSQMDHSKMGNMDHSKMNMPNTSNK